MRSLIMIMRHQLHLRKNQGTITPMMTHRLGAATRAGIDLHLGQKPKLGGRYADDSLIYILYFVGSLYIHVSPSLLFSFLFSFLPKHKKTKNSFLPLVCFTCYFSLLLEKPKNILLCLPFPSAFVSKIENTKIFVVLLWFCKACCRVQSPVTPLELGIHFISFKPHK
jgi:hypothetical protein